ncbi:MAG: ABC transporter ATP-binding protein [Dongiaceae bacterium]
MSGSTDQQPLVRLRGVCKQFGGVAAVHPLDLTINRGDFLAILGPSGCGKTTLLNIISGFLFPDAGSIEIDGLDVTRVPPERRETNMVFQSYGLFPHMTVEQNIAYGMWVAGTPHDECKQRVAEMVALVHLDGLERRNVTGLSGGQQQRVALARALIMRPKVLLLDEPLAALDLQLRKAMQIELRRIHRSIGGTFVFVTHDQGEAMALANRIAVMQGGRIVQEGTPRQIYDAPSTRFVSTFIGDANLLRGQARGGAVTLAAGPGFAHAGADGPVVAVVRPEQIQIGRPGAIAEAPDRVLLAGTVQDVIYVGTYVRFQVAVNGTELIVHASSGRAAPVIEVGAPVAVWWSVSDHLVLPEE